jgi:hypothetical protein
MNASVTGAISTVTDSASSSNSSATIKASEVSAPCPNSVVRDSTVTAPSGAMRINPLRRIAAGDDAAAGWLPTLM